MGNENLNDKRSMKVQDQNLKSNQWNQVKLNTVNCIPDGKSKIFISLQSASASDNNNSEMIESDDPSIFKLTVHCFYEIFDWLPQKDLISLGQTCKRMQRVTGNFFHSNYAAKFARAEKDGIFVSTLQSNIFSEFIQKLSISGDRLESYRYVSSNCSNSIKHLRIYDSMPDQGFEYIKSILNGLESLEMNECFFNGEFYENCLKYCPNLKSLNISRSGRIRDKSVIIGTGNEWLARNYPSIVHLEFIEIYEIKCDALRVFFKQNPQLRTFSTDSRGIWENRHALLQCDIKLETVAIDIYKSTLFDCPSQPVSMVDAVYILLQELYKRKFYKQLNLYMVFIGQENVEKLFTLKNIEMVNGDIARIDRKLEDVSVLAVWCGDEIANIEYLPHNLPNLKRLYFTRVSSHRVASFVRYSVHLKEIRIRAFIDGDQFAMVDLEAWNEEREKLEGAQKTTIFVKEDPYLKAKWTMKKTRFSLIELKRFESAEWEELSARAKYLKSF